MYRARDSRLGRDVAIKVLPDSLANDPEVRARFEREARTVSSLNHPNICTLFDVGREGDTNFLVMELIEGETLADRLQRGALPTEQVLALGSQISDALDRAHRAGVIHRDLKPGNVMLTRSGAKLMDFGLARATGMVGTKSSSGVTVAGLTQSPTVAAPLTAEGTIVGTFQYMSPEQLEGREVDARSDLWALGCVLYEMATGRRAFEGKSQASLIGAIMNTEPTPLSQLVPASPPALDRLVRACLAKDPDERIQTAHDVKLQLRWTQEGGSQSGVPAPVAAGRKGVSTGAMLAMIASVVGGVAVIAADRLLFRTPPPAVIRFAVSAGGSIASVRWPMVSPNGRFVAFMGSDSTGASQIYVRPLDSMEARPLPGTGRTQRPFWSSDSRTLVYIVSGKMYRLPLNGAAPVAFADAPGGSDGSWGKEYIIYDGSGADTIRGVPVNGGKVIPITRLDRSRGEIGHAWPSFLPDGKHFLFIANDRGSQVSTIKLGRIGSLESRPVGQTDSRALFANGYLFYTAAGNLLAQRFDPGSGKTSGEAVPITDHIMMSRVVGDFAVSRNGVLIFRESTAGPQTRLVWADRAGRMLGDAGPPGQYDEVRLSPDGRRAALRIYRTGGGAADIWVRDLVRNTTSRLTFDSSDHVWPVWTPDGSRLAYASNRSGEFRTYIRASSGVGGEDSLIHMDSGQDGPTDWSSDGRTIALSRNATTAWDMLLQTPGGKPEPFIATQFSERMARFSPNGRWLAYASNESGRHEVYVVPAAGGGGKWQVSTQGGDDPFWRADGKEILYIAADRSITAVPVEAGESFEPGTPQPLFRAEIAEGPFTGTRWCPTADGQRFLMVVPTGGPGGTTFTAVTNWPTELRKKR